MNLIAIERIIAAFLWKVGISCYLHEDKIGLLTSESEGEERGKILL